MKYRIGQRVKLKKLEECERKIPGIKPAMEKFFGKEIVLSGIVSNKNFSGIENVYESNEAECWYFNEDWIECVVGEKKDPIDLEIERLQNLKKAKIVQKEIDKLRKLDEKFESDSIERKPAVNEKMQEDCNNMMESLMVLAGDVKGEVIEMPFKSNPEPKPQPNITEELYSERIANLEAELSHLRECNAELSNNFEILRKEKEKADNAFERSQKECIRLASVTGYSQAQEIIKTLHLKINELTESNKKLFEENLDLQDKAELAEDRLNQMEVRHDSILAENQELKSIAKEYQKIEALANLFELVSPEQLITLNERGII